MTAFHITTEVERMTVFAAFMAARGASFEETFLGFRRTGVSYLHALVVLREVFPSVSLGDARTFFESRFNSSLLNVSQLIVDALRSAFPSPPQGDARSALIRFLGSELSALAVAAHFEEPWDSPWRATFDDALNPAPLDVASLMVTADLLEKVSEV